MPQSIKLEVSNEITSSRTTCIFTMATSSSVPSTRPIYKKSVSFCDASCNTIYIVENYKLAFSSIGERARVWYERTELDKFAKDEFVSQFDGTEEEADIAFEMTRNSRKRKRKRIEAFLSPLPLLTKVQIQQQFLLNQKLHTNQHYYYYNRGTKQDKNIATDNKSVLNPPTRYPNLQFHSNHNAYYTTASRYHQTPTLEKKYIAAAKRMKDRDPRALKVPPTNYQKWFSDQFGKRLNNDSEPSIR